MSYEIVCWLTCDTCHESMTASNTNESALRAKAKSNGWTHDGTTDTCGECITDKEATS